MLFQPTFLLISIALLTNAFPDGAGVESCQNRMPQHGVPRQFTSPPYFVSISVPSVRPGQIVSVFIQRTLSTMFIRGFIAEARTAGGVLLGQFLPTEGMRVMDCDPIGSTATHSSPEPRTAVTLRWLPPPGGWVGEVFFQ